MYRAVDPVLNAAEGVMDRQVARAEAREAFVDRRFLELRGLLRSAPSAKVRAIWSMSTQPSIAVELVSFVLETEVDPDAVLASALFNGIARDELIERFCVARAEAEADKLGDSYWSEAA